MQPIIYGRSSFLALEVLPCLGCTSTSVLWQFLLLRFVFWSHLRLWFTGAGRFFLHASFRLFCCCIRRRLAQLWLLRLFLLDVVQSHAHNGLLKLLHFSSTLLGLLVHLTLLIHS